MKLDFFKLIWGHFEALLEHETAINLQKVYSLLSCLTVEYFSSAENRNLRKFQQNSFSGKFWTSDSFLSFRGFVLLRKLQCFSLNGVLHSLSGALGLSNSQKLSPTITKMTQT